MIRSHFITLVVVFNSQLHFQSRLPWPSKNRIGTKQPHQPGFFTTELTIVLKQLLGY